MSFHIGKKIKEVLYQKGISVSEFAKSINRSRNVVYDIFERESIDTKLLQKISKVLDYNFFSTIVSSSTSLSTFQDRDASAGYKNLKNDFKMMQKDMEILKLQNEHLKKENDLLKEVIKLIKKKEK